MSLRGVLAGGFLVVASIGGVAKCATNDSDAPVMEKFGEGAAESGKELFTGIGNYLKDQTQPHPEPDEM